MKKKRIVIALGHEALGSTLPEEQKAAARTAKAVRILSAKIIRWLLHTAMDRRLA